MPITQRRVTIVPNAGDGTHGVYLARGAISRLYTAKQRDRQRGGSARENIDGFAAAVSPGPGRSFSGNPRRPLIVLILEEQATINCGWPDGLVRYYYPNLRHTLACADIPTAGNKCSPPEEIANTEKAFIVHTVDLAGKLFRLSPTKWAKLTAEPLEVQVAQIYKYEKWISKIGRLSWYVALAARWFRLLIQ